MANVTIDVGNGYYESDSLPFANQRCVNLYPNYPQAPALSSTSLFEVQGIEEVLTTSRNAADSNRGSWVFNAVPFFVNGDFLYRLDRSVGFGGAVSYKIVTLGEIEGTGAVSMSDNGRQLIIIDSEGNGHIYQPTANPQLQSITDAGFQANGIPKRVVFIDSYFVVTTNQKKAIISSPNDGTNWNALDFISAEADPDEIVAPFVFKNQLYLLGAETTETYRNIGGAGVPFQRINGFVLSQGCIAPNSVQSIGNKVLWVGNGANEQPVIWLFNGSEPQKISSTAIDTKIHELSEEEVSNIYSWSYSLRGHEFIAFTASNWTFIFDTATTKWHERESETRDTRGFRITKPCRIRTVVSAYNELLVGDSEDGRIGLIKAGVYKEYDEPLISFFTTSPLYDMGNSFSLPSIEVLCDSGVGNSDAPNPEIRLEVSRDGAVFENPRTRYLGAVGDRKIRQIWYKNGRVSRYCIFKVTVSDFVKRRFFGMELTYKRGLGSGQG